jgi:hypothetical protein
MNLYEVYFTADVKFGAETLSEHEIIVSAEAEGEVKAKAENWFLNRPGVTSANPASREIKIRNWRNFRQVESVVIYNQKLGPISYSASGPDYAAMSKRDFRAFVDHLTGPEFKAKYDADAQFKTRVDKGI